jgi:hypothetical protein
MQSRECDLTALFTEVSKHEGQDWHNLCLIAHNKEEGGVSSRCLVAIIFETHVQELQTKADIGLVQLLVALRSPL